MNHRRIIALAMTPLCAGLALTTGPSYAGHSSAHATQHSARGTTFAFKSSGFGTRVIGGRADANSSTTGYKVIGCTNQTGRSRTNNVGEATLPGLGKASDIRTRVWTTSHKGVVASHSTHKIGQLSLVQSALGSLSLTAITSRATAFHDASGFHATTRTQLGGISFTPPIGPAQTFPAPTPDQPIAIPGLATIYAGQHVTHHSSTGARANTFALRVDVIPSNTSIRIAHSRAELDAGLTGGVFSGRSAATHVVEAAGGTLHSGPNPLTTMPCQGTYGRVKAKSLASGDLGSQLLFTNANSRERGNQHHQHAWGTSRAAVGRVDLGGQVLVAGVVGKVSVSRHGDHLTKSTQGTRLGSVTVSGKQQVFPKTGVLEIPGVAKLERAVVTRTRNGISVIGLRVTLLDGSGAVVNFGEASLKIRHLRH
ncbi:MAG TPA: choice-of-anchor P family protein [Nocardioides sp.]|jgi:hypothetical protein|nr:choice-of-anchor P family protein [Nocardioides sp.]